MLPQLPVSNADVSFPDYYGGNLDALHDCLGDISEKTHLIIQYCSEMEVALGEYGSALLKVLILSAEENDFLTISFNEGSESSEDLKDH
ncbi:MAG: barstar family protein [Clostridiales bacterium]|nr:barstar family protein [Clostridiales bacterium]